MSLLTDLYELTMMQGYFFERKNFEVVFDMYYRYQPFKGGYSTFAGLKPLAEAILNFGFNEDDIMYLEKLKLFKKEFLDFLLKFKFSGDIYSVEEGEIIFPKEPLIRVHGNILEAQIIETLLLNIINFQTLIATKAARISEAAKGKAIIEFGARRAQGIDGALSATRAAFIGGAAASSNVLAGKLFNIPVKGTMAHSWVMAFNSELEAFKKYAKYYPENTILLIDTYDTLKKGIPNAIKVFRKLKASGIKNFGIRLDSGDLEYLSKESRFFLDKAGLKEAKIIVSNELDENIIEELVNKKSPIDFFGVGTNLVTAKGDSALPGVYKLVARKNKKGYIPSIKVSNDPVKITNPGVKNILRIYDNSGFIYGDLIFLEQERHSIEKRAKNKQPFVFHHPNYDYKSRKIEHYGNYKMMLKNIIKNGEINYKFPDLAEIQNRAKQNLQKLHPSYKRLLNPHIYHVSITKNLMELKKRLIKRFG